MYSKEETAIIIEMISMLNKITLILDYDSCFSGPGTIPISNHTIEDCLDDARDILKHECMNGDEIEADILNEFGEDIASINVVKSDYGLKTFITTRKKKGLSNGISRHG